MGFMANECITMNISYIITPFACWLVAGSLKFFVNSLRSKGLALKQIGYGGFPSNHSAIVSGTAALIAFREGINHPALGVALTLCFIVMLDANSLRRQIGIHAQAINTLTRKDGKTLNLRERMGHSKIEILGGIFVGTAVAFIVKTIF